MMLVMKDFQWMSAWWASHVCRGKLLDEVKRQLKLWLVTEPGRTSCLALSDHEAKTLGKKHKAEQGHNMGQKGISNHGFLFFYAAKDEIGEWHLGRSSFHCLYKQQTAQTLDEACGGMLVGMDFLRRNFRWMKHVVFHTDCCNNLHSYNVIPHVLHGNDTGWVLPDTHGVDTPAAPTSSTAPEARLVGRHIIGAKLSKEFDGHDGVHSGVVFSYDDDSKLYKIHYDDGDKEDMYFAEVEKVLRAEDETPPSYPPPRPAPPPTALPSATPPPFKAPAETSEAVVSNVMPLPQILDLSPTLIV
jgi:hypothetical protein